MVPLMGESALRINYPKSVGVEGRTFGFDKVRKGPASCARGVGR